MIFQRFNQNKLKNKNTKPPSETTWGLFVQFWKGCIGTPGPGYPSYCVWARTRVVILNYALKCRAAGPLRSGVHLAGPVAPDLLSARGGSGDATCPREGSARRR